ncbi:MAG: hypothetical protein HC802_00940 [Caldilineaceae bacterium]|nr:hypothetical protein [Caldilineaceae bacterium]
MGPVEYLVVEFPGNQFKGEIVPALAELTGNGTIRIIDLLFIKKDADGAVTWLELEDLNPSESGAFDSVDGEIDNLLNEEDILLAAEMLAPNSSAAMVVFENAWATRLRDAVVNANGRVVDNARVPASIVNAALAAAGIEDE